MPTRKGGLQQAPQLKRRAESNHPLAQREVRDEAALLLPIERITPDPAQPRKTVSEESVGELAESIREHGILQPLIVLEVGETYKIVAGERRYRAAQLVGLEEVPVRVIHTLDRVREIQLVENLQRKDLDLFEEAAALAELKEQLDASIRGLEKATGKSKSYIGRRLKILEMPEDVQEMLKREPQLLSSAEAVAKIKDPQRRTARIAALLNRDEAKPRAKKQGRPVAPLSFKTRKDGSFDLVVKYRPGQTDKQELLFKLREMVAKLEEGRP